MPAGVGCELNVVMYPSGNGRCSGGYHDLGCSYLVAGTAGKPLNEGPGARRAYMALVVGRVVISVCWVLGRGVPMRGLRGPVNSIYEGVVPRGFQGRTKSSYVGHLSGRRANSTTKLGANLY